MVIIKKKLGIDSQTLYETTRKSKQILGIKKLSIAFHLRKGNLDLARRYKTPRIYVLNFKPENTFTLFNNFF